MMVVEGPNMSFACYKTAPGAVPTHDYVSVPFDKTPRQAVRDHGGPEAVFEHLYANEEDAKARKARDTQ